MNKEELEKMCKKCGLCCHTKKKLLLGGYVILPYHKCEYLTEDNLCSIYENRLEINPEGCLSLEQALNEDYILPKNCPYTKLKPGYKGCLVMDKDTQEKMWNQDYLLNTIFR